ncbi:C40 family peptidase [Acerihabitans sp. TG2]|uniref:C40 family peptidase n=1 Tax=Acerihabitans sp. TG2 TaxID=3096008 RepID=UPI002B22B02F|nr:C40 family peptidase [Acerihabitans sp. TG2]MEA9391108.1 C40 family peptidase [Acerihabitans sp. TG2]
MRLCFTLFVLLFTQLFFNLAHAAPNAGVNADQRKSQSTAAKASDRRKRKPVKIAKKNKLPATEKISVQKISISKARVKKIDLHKTKNENLHGSAKIHTKKIIVPSDTKKIAKITKPKKGYKVGYGRHRIKHQAKTELISNQPIKMSDSHKRRYQHAKLTAMNKLLSQMGKPYHWGGKSPTTGFDCSGLIYYAYKDVVRIHMPRTANEMFHLRDAAPVKKDELESGDLVFFHISNRGAADHVGVYLGNGKFIQSPRTGSDIRISYLNEDYWQDHYVGARRVVTPKTIR